MGMTFVIITGGIELSVGSGLAFLGCVAALLAKSDGLPFAMLIAITVCLGAVIGGINGTLVTRGKFQPFIATLAAMVTLRGLAFRITDSKILRIPVPNFATKFGGFSSSISIPIPAPIGRILGTDQFWNPVPVFAIIFLIAVIVGQVLLAKITVSGHRKRA